MKKEDKNILRRFERKIIRRIYGPVRLGRKWRIRNNEEIDNIIRKKDIVRFVKTRRISWIGQVERMEDSRMSKRVMRVMGTEGWRRKARDRDQWRRIAQEAKAHVGL
jgi:Holliday junction resolvase-like predicted endonuclease